MPKRAPAKKAARSISKAASSKSATSTLQSRAPRGKAASKAGGSKKETKPTSERVRKRLTIRDRLGHLTYRAACRMLGKDGEARLRAGFGLEALPGTARFDDHAFQVSVRMVENHHQTVRVSILETHSRDGSLRLECDHCEGLCEHISATLLFVLEEKLLLGLSQVPDPDEPLELLTPAELVERAFAERQVRALQERMRIVSSDVKTPWTNYSVTSLESGRTYQVALRGKELGVSYCSCPDFRTNQLGTCKHILHTLKKIETKFKAAVLRKPYVRKNISLRVDYAGELGLRFNLPASMSTEVAEVVSEVADKLLDDPNTAVRVIRKLEAMEESVHIYPDAEAFIEQRLIQKGLIKKCNEIRQDPSRHPLRRKLLKAELLPYQLDGIAFAVGAGRAILADDMGLGKTIQGIGTAELLARLSGIRNVLVVCPASLKSQWRSEITRFVDRSCQIVMGSSPERVRQYQADSFFKIANYEQIVRDEAVVTAIAWDLVILDEGQRIKNWESKTSRVFKLLKSTFALVLSGTPLENRLDELYNVVNFVDAHRLGPAYRFFHRHRTVTDEGRLAGYKNLEQLRESLKPILLRRTRSGVMQELPERTTEIVRIRPTDEQRTLSNDHVAKAAQIAGKTFLTEIDLLRLQKHLLMARMAANSTILVDRVEPGFSSKLEVLDELLEQLADESTRKIVLFSEWTRMLDLIEPLLTKHGVRFVRLDGSVPQRKRQMAVDAFQNDPTCRAIIMSNAGSTGLNLQSANTVINIDLPWNPAVLEQRIARAHRMGQKNPVQVFLLVTEETLEEKLLTVLADKQELSTAALDVDSEIDSMSMEGGITQMKARMEKLLGQKPEATIDESMRREVETEVEMQKRDEPPAVVEVSAGNVEARREKVAAASGELLGAALNLVSQLVGSAPAAKPEVVEALQTNLAQCVTRDAEGRPQLKLTLPDDAAVASLAATLAKLLVH